ncbi:MAG: tetratricopeptide repeat protein [Acidobacteria bacterium]|nr:tetratricopeptide repeat protein [Acidobacteriota bacterium]
MRKSLTIATLALLLWPSPAAAQNREHLQLNADLRMLQEHVSRLQLSVNRLEAQQADTNKRLDAATNASVKGFADQQLLINQLSATLTSVRERLDDNSVRVSQLGQEFTAIREGVRRLTEQINALVSLLQPPVDAAAPAAAATPGATPPSTAANTPASPEGQTAPPPGLAPVIMPTSAPRIYSQAMGDYMSQRYDIAIEGFREVIQTYPTAPDAANAQFQIGESFYQKKDCRSAIPEYQKFVDTYKDSDRRHEGLFMLGVCYSDLNQRTNAQRAFERVLKEHPASASAMMATQRLQGMGIKPQ